MTSKLITYHSSSPICLWPQKPMDLPSDIGKVQLRSPDRQMPKTRPSSDTDYPDELAIKLAMRNSALSSDSTGSCLHGQTLHDQHTTSSWKQPQNHDNQLPKPLPKKVGLLCDISFTVRHTSRHLKLPDWLLFMYVILLMYASMIYSPWFAFESI